MFGGAFANISAALAPAMGSLAPIVAAIAVVVVALVDLWNTSESFRNAVTEAFTKVKDSLTDAFKKVSDAIGPLWEAIKNLGSSLYDFYENSGLKGIIALFAELVVSIIGSGLSTVIDVLSTAFAGLAEVFTGLSEVATGILEFFNGLFTLDFDRMADGIALVGKGIVDTFGGLGELLFETGIDIIGGLLGGILDAVKDIGGWLKEFVIDPFIEKFKNLFGIHSPSTVMAELGGYVMDGLLSGLKEKVGGVLDWASELPGKIKDKLGDAKEWLKEKGKGAIEGLKNGWESVKQSKFLDKVGKIAGEARTAIGDVKEKVKSKDSDIIGGLKGGFDGAWKDFKGTLSGLGSKVKNALPNFKDIGKNAMQGLSDGFRSIGIKLPHIKVSWNKSTVFGNEISTPSFGVEWYAKGGYAYKPSVVGIGEAGDEAILPLENRRTMGMIVDRILNSYSGGNGIAATKQDIMEAVEEGVVMALMNNIQRLKSDSQQPINVTVKLQNDEAIARAAIRGQQSIDYRTNPTPSYG